MSEFTFDQELQIKNFEYQIQKASPEQAQQLALDLFKQLLQQQNASKELFKAIAIDPMFPPESLG